jgi:hypothetical protein
MYSVVEINAPIVWDTAVIVLRADNPAAFSPPVVILVA